MSLEYEYNNDDPDFDLEDRWRHIFHLLGKHECEVTFTKVDGSLRTMPCTLMDSLLPPKPVTEDKKPREINYNTLSAYALDKNEWRSFRVANVTHIRVLS